MFYENIKNFPKQLGYKPMIQNGKKIGKPFHYIVAGMGGSHLAADILKCLKPSLPMIIHKDYGLPELDKAEFKKSFLIASSYSGNTEETLDSLLAAKKQKMPRAVLSAGGKLIAIAKKEKIPFVQIPEKNLQPRMALGFSFNGLLKIISEKKLLAEAHKLSAILPKKNLENTGRELTAKINNYFPVVYSSAKYESLAQIWKIKFNETAKTPSFYNVLPELNHNEMIGTANNKFYFIILRDKVEDQRILKRMAIFAKIYSKLNLPVSFVDLESGNAMQKVFSSLWLADWTSYYLAKKKNVDPEKVTMVEEFKRLMKN